MDEGKTEKKTGFSGFTKARNYNVDVTRFNVVDVWRHLLNRGHSGRVTCVDVNANCEYVVTGGVDWTMRVWKYSDTHCAYDVIAVVNIPIPEQFKAPRTDLGGCLSCLPFCKPKIDWDVEKKQGLTCITITHSLQEFQGHDAMSELYNNGPVVGGTAEGSLYVLDFSLVGKNEYMIKDGQKVLKKRTEKSEKHGVFCKKCLHTGSIDDVGMSGARKVKPGQLGPELFILTSSEDTTSKVLKISTQREDNPWKENEQGAKEPPHGCFWDMFFFGRGFRNSCLELDLECLKETGSGAALGKATGLIIDSHEGNDYPEPHECLKILGIEEAGTLKHNAPVLRGHVLAERDEDDCRLRCAFITCTEEGAFLWNKYHERMMKLCVDGPSKHWDTGKKKRADREFQVSKHIGMGRRKSLVRDSDGNEHSQTVIFLSGAHESESHVGVWGLRDGYLGVQDVKGNIIYRKDNLEESLKKWRSNKDPKFKSEIKPICIYLQKGTSIDLDQFGASVSFAVSMIDRETVGVFKTAAVKSDELIIPPDDALNLLRCPGKEEVTHTLTHGSNICDLRVAANPQGSVLVTACNDSSVFLWDLEGPDAGQVISIIRSMKVTELLLPPALLLITGCQMISFAFGPSVPWEKEAHAKAKVAHSIMMFDVQYTLELDKEVIFWPEMYFVCSWMASFAVCALIGMPEIIKSWIHKYCNSDFYKSGAYCGLPNRVYDLLLHLKNLMLLLMQLSSTILLVPMMKLCAAAVDCVQHEDDPEMVTLAAAPNIECYQDHHKDLTIILSFLVPTFLFCVMPFAAVLGDANYVPTSCLYDYSFWKDNNSWRLASARKAAAMHRGVMGVRPRRAFISLFTETIAKILLPCVATWTTRYPMRQVVLIATIGFFQWSVSIFYPQYLERKFTVLVQNVKFFTLLAMFCGVFTVIVDDPTNFLPLHCLYFCGVVCVCTAIAQLATMEAVKPEVTIFEADDSRGCNTPSSGGRQDEKTPFLAKENV